MLIFYNLTDIQIEDIDSINPEGLNLVKHTQGLKEDTSLFIVLKNSQFSHFSKQLILLNKLNFPITLLMDEFTSMELKSFLSSGVIKKVIISSKPERIAEIITDVKEGKNPPHFYFKEGSRGYQYSEFKKPIYKPTKKYKVALFLLPSWNFNFVPYGLSHISSSLKDEGYDVKCFDLNLKFWHFLKENKISAEKFETMSIWQDRTKFNKELGEIFGQFFLKHIKEVLDSDFDAFGFSAYDSNLFPIFDCLKYLKGNFKNKKTFIGGPSADVNFIKGLFNENLLDASVIGEGEITVKELIKAFEDNTPNPKIHGCVFSSEEALIPRKLTDINSINFPDYSDFDLLEYKIHALPVFFSRGCVARCTFCSETEFWERFRIKNIDRIVDEMKMSFDLYGINNFFVNDSLMNGSHKLLEMICNKIIEDRLDINFSGYCRIDNKLTDKLLTSMKDSGCRGISFGIESGSQKMLDLMQKEVQSSEIVPTLERTFKAGIPVNGCVMVGFPGEGWPDYFRTLFVVLKSKNLLNMLNISIFGLSHRSKMAQAPEKYKLYFDNQKGWVSKERFNSPYWLKIKFKLLKFIWSFKNEHSESYRWEYESEI